MKYSTSYVEAIWLSLEKLGPYSMKLFGVLWESFRDLKDAIIERDAKIASLEKSLQQYKPTEENGLKAAEDRISEVYAKQEKLVQDAGPKAFDTAPLKVGSPHFFWLPDCDCGMGGSCCRARGTWVQRGSK
jgi:hypothetical protein